MKTNIIQVILAVIFTGVIALIATSKTAVDFSLLATGISYAAVVLIMAVAAIDHRRNTRNSAR